MTGFDIAVLAVVGLGAVTGFIRGFVQECLVLTAWIVGVVAIDLLLSPMTILLQPYIHSLTGAAVLSFAILLIVPLVGIKLIARRLGSATRNSLIGPVDRVLGFGFGAVKGMLIVVLAFSIGALGYDVVWGSAGRPAWIAASRTYPFINACSDKLVDAISKRRREAVNQSFATDSSSAAGADSSIPDANVPDDAASPTPVPHHHHKQRPE
ncbi:MAG: CvpA family protein [Pseudomonadota bacterium]|nr:CvpA family protein [Pseudomonadota bacterium]